MEQLSVISVLCLCLLGVAFSINPSHEEQKDASDSQTRVVKTGYTQREKALLLGQYLLDNDHLFRQLEEIYYAYNKDFVKSQPTNQVNDIFVDVLLSQIPVLLRSPDFQDVMSIIGDEINRVDIKKVIQLQQANNWTKTNPNVTNALFHTYQHNLNFQRMIQRIMTKRTNATKVDFLYNALAMFNGKCANDTMGFMNSLVDGRNSTVRPKDFNFSTFWWALKSYECSARGGRCQDITGTSCNGHYKRGMCPGSNDILCCFPEGHKCSARRGRCQDITQTSCSGHYKRGLCHGSGDILCCST